MFDIGFFELLIIGVVGLIVIGPEKLPSTIRTCALWIGRIKRSITETRAEVEKQLGADEIRRELHNEQVLRNLERMSDAHKDLRDKIQSLEHGGLEHESTAPPTSNIHEQNTHEQDNHRQNNIAPPISDHTIEHTEQIEPNHAEKTHSQAGPDQHTQSDRSNSNT